MWTCLSYQKVRQKEEIEKTSNSIYEITGEYPTYVRPPFGEWQEKLEFEVTMLPILWNIDPIDWQRSDVEGIVQDVEKKSDGWVYYSAARLL